MTVPPSAASQDFKVFSGHADPAPVQGSVTYSDGAPIAGVTISGLGVETDAGGWFESGLMFTCGTYTLSPQKPGFTFAPPSLTVTQPNVSGIHFIGTDTFKHSYLPMVVNAK